MNSEARLPRKLTQSGPREREQRVWKLGVCLIPVHSPLVRPHPELRAQFVEIHLKIQGIRKGAEEARGLAHYLISYLGSEEAGMFNLVKRSLRAK